MKNINQKNMNATLEATMKKTVKTLIIAMTLTATTGLVFAAGKGTSAGQFLRVGVGARGPAMGGAFSPIANDVTALYWNPAGLAQLERKEVGISYNSYFEDTAAQFLGYAHPTAEKGTFGFGLNMFGVQDIEKRSAAGGDADTPDLGEFDTRDMALSIGWANKRDMGRGKINYGAALKYISSDLETEKAATAALDLGMIYHLREDGGMSLSMALLNAGGELKYDEEGDALPLTVKPGMAYRMNFERMGGLTMAVDADLVTTDGLVVVQPGVEWTPHKVLSLRTGYQIGRDDEAGSGFAAGVGFNLMNLNFDYAFVPYGDLGDSHRVSLGLKF